MVNWLRASHKWLIPGIGIKRWLLLLLCSVLLLGVTLALATLKWLRIDIPTGTLAVRWWQLGGALVLSLLLLWVSIARMSNNMLAPYRRHQQGKVIDVMYAHSKRHKGLRLVAIGGGTGLPSVLRGLKAYTSNLTAVVTVADDGGSSGRLRRDLGVLPPGDLRNNIAALADDESLMTRLFQFRFNDAGDLSGHSFGNLFISALSGVTGSLETALIETERVLNITGRVLPSTVDDVNLVADVWLPQHREMTTVVGESKITEAGGQIQRIRLEPADVNAYHASTQAILDADAVILGPGSLYTSILPNLVVNGIVDALRATDAYKIYVCNVATQPGETDAYTVAEHVLALEQHIGRGVFQAVLANNVYPELDEYSSRTRYVRPAPAHHEIVQRYDVRYTDLVDTDRPWRHDPQKLARAVLSLCAAERSGTIPEAPLFATV